MVKDSRKPGGYSSRCKACLCECNTERRNVDRVKHNTDRRAYLAADARIQLLTASKYRAGVQGVPWNLTRDDIVVPKLCPVFGLPLTPGIGKVWDFSPTLDKIVPELGYVVGNIEVISHLANRIKSNATPDQLMKVAEYYKRQSLLAN